MMKSNTRQLFQKNKGFTLIEILLVITICSIIILPLYAILNTSSNIFKSSKEKDEVILNAKHAIEYLKREIRASDMIIAHHKIKGLKDKYPENIGFVLVIEEERDNPEKISVYKYVTYHVKDNKLVRIACEGRELKYPSKDELQGHNEICRMIESMSNTNFDIENSMIKLDFDFKSSIDDKQRLNVKSDIYIRCEIDY